MYTMYSLIYMLMRLVYWNVTCATPFILITRCEREKCLNREAKRDRWRKLYFLCTACLRSSAPFYIVTYYIKWVTTSWTDLETNI